MPSPNTAIRTIRQINTSEDRIDRLIGLCESAISMALAMLRHHIDVVDVPDDDDDTAPFFLEADKNAFALLYPQLKVMPASDAHAFSFLPDWVQKSIVDGFMSLIRDVKGDVRKSIAKFKDEASRVSEKYDIHLDAYLAKKYNVVVLVDRPTRRVMILDVDDDWMEGDDPTGEIEIEVD